MIELLLYSVHREWCHPHHIFYRLFFDIHQGKLGTFINNRPSGLLFIWRITVFSVGNLEYRQFFLIFEGSLIRTYSWDNTVLIIHPVPQLTLSTPSPRQIMDFHKAFSNSKQALAFPKKNIIVFKVWERSCVVSESSEILSKDAS